jgi:large subunit ribosomal protein L23
VSVVPQDIIDVPYVTEKAMIGTGLGWYTFKVKVDATKLEVRQAIEQLFSVQVLKVNTIRYDGKKKRMGVHRGRRSKWKKAMVKIDQDPTSMVYMAQGGKPTTSQKKFKDHIEGFESIVSNKEE